MAIREFEAVLGLAEFNSNPFVCLEVPFSVEEAFGIKGRMPVRVTLNGAQFRTSLFPQKGGPHMMMVNQDMQRQAEVGAGDTVRVQLEQDTEPRVAAVPTELAEELARCPQAAAAFQKLPYSHKKEHADYVAGAVQEETRRRRAVRTVERLQGVTASRTANPVVSQMEAAV